MQSGSRSITLLCLLLAVSLLLSYSSCCRILLAVVLQRPSRRAKFASNGRQSSRPAQVDGPLPSSGWGGSLK
ncbi:hypothetical protein EV126DRAFT_427388 [Verticillium dahliae]|nr:hypothetical protein EV126DRAFT_427388 [Verticillium dahliae]